MIVAPTSTGGTYLVTSTLRVDTKDQAIDQEPFGLIVHSTGASPMGMFLHHGDWEGRTEYPPQRFRDEVSESGIGDYFFTNPTFGDENTLVAGLVRFVERVSKIVDQMSTLLE